MRISDWSSDVCSSDLLNPTSGFRLTAHVSPEISFGRGTNPYARGMIEGSAYYPVSEAIVLAGRVRVASIAGADRTDIAPSRRLSGGGGGSVRGFRSEGRRVGQECGRTCRSRWSPYA